MIDQPQLFDSPPAVVQITKEDRRLTIQKRFEKFHQLNPWVYRRLVTLARDLRKRGHKRMGINMLWELVRWQYYQNSHDPTSGYHLNDHYPSRYARLIMDQEEDLKTAFETRKIQSE